jgi:hypothetical protein
LYAKNINATAYVKGAAKTSPPTVIPGDPGRGSVRDLLPELWHQHGE